jgi:hypothetical protein
MSAGCIPRSKVGECEVEGSGMVGPGGVCRKTCGDCKDFLEGDRWCAHKNMEGLMKAASSALGRK